MQEKEFFDWLVRSGQKESTAGSVLSRVRRIEGVYPDLDSRIEDNSIEALLNVFTYTKKDEEKNIEPLHKVEIDGDQYTGTQSLRTALIQYIEFSKSDKPVRAKTSVLDSVSDETKPISKTSEKIYRIDSFREWMPENGVSSTASYISFLRKLGDMLRMKSDHTDMLEYVSGLFQADNTALAFEVLQKADEKLSSLLASFSISREWKKDINNWRSALRKYVYFLRDEIEDIPDEEELEEISADAPTLQASYSDLNDAEEGDVIEYPLDELKKNFAFRLSTQNRMSNDKDIFYPISIIRKLFCYSQRNGKKTGVPNNDYDWFKNWIEDYVGEIKVLLDDTSYPLSDVKELRLYPATENVYIQRPDVKGDLWVYTETVGGKKEPMKANSLSNIHIDHSPVMAQVLTNNISLLPAIDALSKEIKSVAKAKRIDLKPKNFGKISKLLFADGQYVSDRLIPLIPALKDELNLLRKECTLTLMQASHNLKKK